MENAISKMYLNNIKKTFKSDPYEKICKTCGKKFFTRGKWCPDCFKKMKEKNNG